ncbi:Aste57867_21489 [Aphanomyces stellatus]|uniref:Aste57867_21489 protein n=1 Tax=Aphanomyces stellatus TaxID=120398 RepID=A0A485LHM1_9STRA|nr:hypothetical protein As57867_021420 [Aphanomyces stellatus]VFT98159.1 Aste57867_21489 [Aphanomyces stellatus]
MARSFLQGTLVILATTRTDALSKRYTRGSAWTADVVHLCITLALVLLCVLYLLVGHCRTSLSTMRAPNAKTTQQHTLQASTHRVHLEYKQCHNRQQLCVQSA